MWIFKVFGIFGIFGWMSGLIFSSIFGAFALVKLMDLAKGILGIGGSDTVVEVARGSVFAGTIGTTTAVAVKKKLFSKFAPVRRVVNNLTDGVDSTKQDR